MPGLERAGLPTDPSSNSNNIPVQTPVPLPPTSIEAKLVILGSQGVGKTSLVNKFINPNASLSVQSTVGASFVTKKIHDSDTNTTVRLQVWDTAGQERFRSISRLYYRGANAGILCYDVTNEKSWEEMKGWLAEMRENCDFSFNEDRPGTGMVLHVVGTKIDLVADDPSLRAVPFERTIAYVAEQLVGGNLNLNASQASTPPMTMTKSGSNAAATTTNSNAFSFQNPESKRSSGFWTQDLGWDSCHEVSSFDNDGIEEVFRVIARKLIEQRNKREAYEQQTPWIQSSAGGEQQGDYFSHGAGSNVTRGSTGSFRLGHGGHRKSWLGLPSVTAGLGRGGNNSTERHFESHGSDEMTADQYWSHDERAFTKDPEEARRRGRCC